MRWKSYDHKVFIISHQTPGLLYFAIFMVAEIRIFTRHSYVHKLPFNKEDRILIKNLYLHKGYTTEAADRISK